LRLQETYTGIPFVILARDDTTSFERRCPVEEVCLVLVVRVVGAVDVHHRCRCHWSSQRLFSTWLRAR